MADNDDNGRRGGVGKHQLTLSLDEQETKRNKMSESVDCSNDSDNDLDFADASSQENDENKLPPWWKQMEVLVSNSVTKSLAALTPRVDRNEQKIQDLESRIKQLETTVSSQNNFIDSLKATVESSHKETISTLKSFKNDVTTHDGAIMSIKTAINRIESVTDRSIKDMKANIDGHDLDIDQLYKQDDEMDQYGRRNTLRVTGIPEDDDTDILKFFIEAIAEHCKVKISPADIDRCHWLQVPPKKKDDDKQKPRPAVFKFVSYAVRRSVYDKRKLLKDSGLFLNEHLTRTRSKLLFDARQYKHDGTVSNAWSYDGRIMVKTKGGRFITINSIKHLDYCLSLPDVPPKNRKTVAAAKSNAPLTDPNADVEPFENLASSTRIGS